MGVIDYIKDAAKLAQELNRMDLYQHLLSAQEEVLELRTELLRLREENTNLNSKLSTKESLIFDKSIYWIKNDTMTPGLSNTPVCPKCFDDSGKVIRGTIEQFEDGPSLHCRNCGKFCHT